jgi:hypothetical protein
LKPNSSNSKKFAFWPQIFFVVFVFLSFSVVSQMLEPPPPPFVGELLHRLHSPPDNADEMLVFVTRKISAFEIIPMTASAAAFADVDSGDDCVVVVAGCGPGGSNDAADDGMDVVPSAPSMINPPPSPKRDLLAGEALYFQKLATKLVVPAVATLVMLLLLPPGEHGPFGELDGPWRIPVFIASWGDTQCLSPAAPVAVDVVMGDVSAVLFDCDEPFDGVVAQDIGDFTETLNMFPPKTPVFL